MAWEDGGAWQHIVLFLSTMGFPIRLSIVVLATFAALAATTGAYVVFKKKTKFHRLTSKIPAEAGQVIKLKSLYQLYKPPGEPSMEVIFFHGFQRGDYENAHISSWKCRDGSSLWPQTWLVKQFPAAHILSICYGEYVMRNCNGGSIDMHIITENLTCDLLDANIGQAPCRPVIFVGHSFGGLVVRKLCVYASNKIGRLKGTTESSFRLTSLMENLKGMFFYSSPHHGVFEHIAKHFMGEGPLLEYVTTLSTEKARVHDDFDNLCGQLGKYKWQIAGVGEGIPTSLGKLNHKVVEEASARYGSFNVVEGADHITVCRPIDNNCRSFYALANFLGDVAAHSKEMVHGLPDHPTGLQRLSSELQQQLKSTPVLGIVGMGGIGKTTIAKQLFNDLCPQFEYTCFVDNVKELKIHELNDWILKHFLRGGARLEQNSMQWSDLERKKALITMDDVNCEDQVRILPGLKNFGDGSRVIFTTRDQGVMNRFSNCFIHNVSFLKFDEAKKLFCQRAFEEEGIPENLLVCNGHLEGNVKEVVEKCNGLPLTLEVMGSYLRCHKTNGAVWKGQKTNSIVWKQTLDKLGSVESIDGLQKDRVWDSLRLSFDALAPKEQGMFIEAGMYFFKRPVETALAAWSTAYGDSEMRWANLLRVSLVKEEIKTEFSYPEWKDITYKEVWVHEHLRDLARSLKEAIISRSVAEWYTAPRTSWIVSVEEQNSILQTLKSLDLFRNLKYLELVEFVQEGLTKNVLAKLSLLKGILYNRRHLPISLEYMTNIAVLELEEWEISEERFEALEKLSYLRILSLSRIEGPVRLPDNFGYLLKLKQLRLKNLQWLKALPQSFGELSALEDLVLFNCGELLELPESFGSLYSLTKLVISKCGKLANLPKSMRCLSSLVELCIRGCHGLKGLELPGVRQLDSGENLSSLISLIVEDCNSLKTLPVSFESLPSLEEFTLCCREVQTLPETLGLLKALKRLTCCCESLEALPDSFGNLPALTVLHLESLTFERLPMNFFENLSSLQELKFESCDRLQSLPDFGKLKNLGQLEIINLSRLEALPDDFGILRSLKFLTLKGCHRLETLPESFGLLSALQKLSVENCRQFQRLPDNFGLLAALRELCLSRCLQLQSLPDNFAKLSALEDLSIRYSSRLEALPDDFGNLRSLEFLSLEGCESLERLPESFGLLSALQKLVLVECEGLDRLPDNFGLLTALRELHMDSCPIQQSLPDNFCELTALEILLITDVLLEALPDDFGNLRSLQFLALRDCPHLERLPESFGLLSALQSLSLRSCPHLERLPESFGRLAALRKLKLTDCNQLQIFQFSELKGLEIKWVEDWELDDDALFK